MAEITNAHTADARNRAARNGLSLIGDITFNETGLDFRIGFATDATGRRWVLRIPRRDDVIPKIEHEARILELVRSRLPVQVPEWLVCGPDLVAYPRLNDPMAYELDSATGAARWNVDRDAPAFATSLGAVLACLHAIRVEDARAAGIATTSSEEARAGLLHDLERVKDGVGIGAELEQRCRRWLDQDSLWPAFSVLTHGDLYAGHVTARPDGRVSGIIDWSEAVIGDPAVDFAGHLATFDPNSLASLVTAYESAGGRTWPRMLEHIEERHAASAIAYGVFALDVGSAAHLAAARAQLGVDAPEP